MIDARPARSRLLATSLAATVALTSFASAAPPQTASAASAAPAAPAAQTSSLPFADSAFENVWLRNDQPVASHAASRTWTWGPAPLASGLEPYADAPDASGTRLVQYFDKSRMEINNPKLASSDKWFVTNGLLT